MRGYLQCLPATAPLHSLTGRHEQIVEHLHHDFCRCPSGFSLPSKWDDATFAGHMHAATGAAPTKEIEMSPGKLQRELCKLRLVNKCFYIPATRYLVSHGTFALGLDP